VLRGEVDFKRKDTKAQRRREKFILNIFALRLCVFAFKKP
jgi:hypothetical protein